MKLENYLREVDERAGKATGGFLDENWKWIPGNPDYQVSSMGNVRSWLRGGNHKKRNAGYPRDLKKSNQGSYQSISLPGGETRGYQHRTIHSLVMLAFIGPRPSGYDIAHMDGDSRNNNISNLKYCTRKENENMKIMHKTNPIGERNGQSKLQGWQIAEMKYLAGKGVGQQKIAVLFDIDHSVVSDVLREKSWKHIASRQDIPKLILLLRAAMEMRSQLRGCCDEFESTEKFDKTVADILEGKDGR